MNRKIKDSVQAPPIGAFKAQARSLRPQPPRHLDMSQAVPWYPAFPAILARLTEELKAGKLDFYTPVEGSPALREALKTRHWSRRGASPSAVITAGANQGMYALLTLLFNPGDRVVLPEPYYFNYEMALRMLGLTPVLPALRPDSGYQPEPERLIAAMERQDPAGLILISPNNPTGAVYSPRDMAALLTWARDKGVRVILDETYLAFDPVADEAKEILCPFLEDTLILLGSFSKAYSLTGYRGGYILLPPSLKQELLKIQDTMVICAPAAAQAAALAGLETGGPELERRREELAGFQREVAKALAGLRVIKLRSIGPFFAYLEFPGSLEDPALALYRNTGILGLPGLCFGTGQGRAVRLAYANLPGPERQAAMETLKSYDARLFAAEKKT